MVTIKGYYYYTGVIGEGFIFITGTAKVIWKVIIIGVRSLGLGALRGWTAGIVNPLGGPARHFLAMWFFPP